MSPELLRNWICPVAQQELNAIIEGKTEYFQRAHRDGDCQAFKVRLCGEERLQVNEFISKSYPYLVWVSDSFTRIRASFTAESTEAFTKNHGRSFLKGTLGAVLSITEYHLGSEGSCNFGRPDLIENVAEIGEILSKISEYDASFASVQVQSQSSYRREEPSPSEESAEHEFYTQAPRKRLQRDVDHDFIDGMSPSARALNELAEPEQTELPENPGCNQGAQVTNWVEGAQEQQQTYLGSKYPASTCQKTETGLEKSLSLPHPLVKNANYSSPRNESFSETSSTFNNVRVDCTNTDTPRTSHYYDINSGKENRQEGLSITSKPIKSRSSKSTPLHDHSIAMPWEGLARIPRKFVQISKDQRALLDRDDSWYSTPASATAKYSNIPSSVMKQLHYFHSRSVSMEVNLTSQGDAIETGSGGQSDKECVEPSQESSEKDVNSEEPTRLQTIDKKHSSDDESATSWSTSPVRANSLSKHHQISSETVTHSGSDSLSAEILPFERPSIECCATTAKNSVKVNAPSNTQSLASTVSISRPLRQAPGAKSTLQLSSSPIEMPLSVPYGLGDQAQSSRSMATSVIPGSVPIPLPSTAETGQPTLQVQRSPYNKVETRSSRTSHVGISSDPLIPATFDDEATNSTLQTAIKSSHSEGQFENNLKGADGVLSSARNLPENSPFRSPRQNGSSLVQQQLQAELEKISQTELNYEAVSIVKGHQSSTFFSGETSPDHVQTILLTQNTAQPEEMIGQQVITPQGFQQGGNNMLLIQSDRIGRTGLCASGHSQQALKRLKSVPHGLFASLQGSDTAIDPSEMAKANRRNFSRQQKTATCSSEIRHLHLRKWRPTKLNGKLHRVRQVSPILGNINSGPVIPTETIPIPSSFPTMISDVRSCPVSSVRFPHIPESGNLGARESSLTDLKQRGPDRLLTLESKRGSIPVAALENWELLSAAAIDSFREFSKVYVPRRKRVSK